MQISTPVITRKRVDTFILSDVNTQKSNPKAQIDVSDEREDSIALEKSPSVDEKEIFVNLLSVMSTLVYIMQCLTLCEQRSIFQR